MPARDPRSGDASADGTRPGGDQRPDPAERAREALRQAKTDAARRGVRRAGTNRSGTRRSRARADDPLPVGTVIEELLDLRGWREPTAAAGVFARWAQVVGAEVAAHTRPESCDDGELVVEADSPAWAAQVRLLAPTLVRRLCEELGDGTVRRVRVRGPTGGKGRTRPDR